MLQSSVFAEERVRVRAELMKRKVENNHLNRINDSATFCGYCEKKKNYATTNNHNFMLELARRWVIIGKDTFLYGPLINFCQLQLVMSCG